jgi:hypothetical protein
MFRHEEFFCARVHLLSVFVSAIMGLIALHQQWDKSSMASINLAAVRFEGHSAFTGQVNDRRRIHGLSFPITPPPSASLQLQFLYR